MKRGARFRGRLSKPARFSGNATSSYGVWKSSYRFELQPIRLQSLT